MAETLQSLAPVLHVLKSAYAMPSPLNFEADSKVESETEVMPRRFRFRPN